MPLYPTIKSESKRDEVPLGEFIGRVRRVDYIGYQSGSFRGESKPPEHYWMFFFELQGIGETPQGNDKGTRFMLHRKVKNTINGGSMPSALYQIIKAVHPSMAPKDCGEFDPRSLIGADVRLVRLEDKIDGRPYIKNEFSPLLRGEDPLDGDQLDLSDAPGLVLWNRDPERNSDLIEYTPLDGEEPEAGDDIPYDGQF